MDLAEFVYGIMNGITGNFMYDQIKKILGNDISNQLEEYKNDRKQFASSLNLVLLANKDMAIALKNLQSGKPTVYQSNINGDSVAGDKIVGNKYSN